MSTGKERAEAIKRKEAIRQSKRERLLQRAPILKVRSEALWEDLCARLSSEIDDFNTSLSDHRERHLKLSVAPDSLEVRKYYYPQEHLTVVLNLPEERIAIGRVTTPAPGKGQRFEMKESLDLDLNDDNDLYVLRQAQIMDIDSILNLLLAHLME